jgi:hypothetical protein
VLPSGNRQTVGVLQQRDLSSLFEGARVHAADIAIGDVVVCDGVRE